LEIERRRVDYSSQSDQTLLGLISQANHEALAELYQRYYRLVFSLAVAIVADRATAEEITLDVFARIWHKADSYRAERAQVNTWLTSITRNRAIDRLRRQQSRVDGRAVGWSDISAENLPSDHNPEQEAELAWQRQRVRAAVLELPEEQREALALAYFKGHSHREIAELLDQPLGTVKTRIRLAMQKLRRSLTEQDKSE
jgi:RNA polymerase sigma-70 factor (ECF subfamily)